MHYRVYPPLGIARLGNSPAEFFIGPERPGVPSVEISPDGSEKSVVDFKGIEYRTKRQAARFWVYEFDDDRPSTVGRPVVLSEGASIRWSIHLANKKDAVVRPPEPPAPPADGETLRPQLVPGRQDRVIDAGRQHVSGANASPVALGGTYQTVRVVLGELRTDARQRLLVLGGRGVSASPSNSPIGDEPGGGGFYTNRDWFDDVSDGPVTATITFQDGHQVDAEPAWVVVAPPDFAPAVRGVVTLYDVIRELARLKQWVTVPVRPSFHRDIRPLLERANALQWVHASPVWKQVSNDWATMSNPSDGAKAEREKSAERILRTEQVFSHPDTSYSTFVLPEWRRLMLAEWVAGRFDVGSTPAPGLDPTPEELTQGALDTSIAQPFFPGIEAGVMLLDPSIYRQPFNFRISHTALAAGDLTALMALPWQADFLKCGTNWWPTQRPNIAVQADGSRPQWLRPANAFDHRRLAADVMRLGVVTEKDDAGQRKMIEVARDPGLG
jgi:hypothetical protein